MSKATFVIMSTPDQPYHAGDIMRTILAPFGGRGGGSQTYAQGSAGKEHKQAIIDAIKQAMGVHRAA